MADDTAGQSVADALVDLRLELDGTAARLANLWRTASGQGHTQLAESLKVTSRQLYLLAGELDRLAGLADAAEAGQS